jgi:phage baseplate assembly protein W
MSWTGRGIDFPFRIGASGKITECGSYNALVRAQVIDAVMTNQGERVFRPRYGCDIQSALFDPSEELVRKDAASYIKKRLENFVSRSIVQSVDIVEGDPGSVVVNIRYRSTPYATISNVQIPVSSEFLNRQGAIQ